MPGYYCLANDINNTLTITADNVTVDLNNHTISAPGTIGVFINGARNAFVTNGRIDNTNNGVELNSTTTSKISNLVITNCSNVGILQTACNAIIFQDLVIDTCSFVGMLGDIIDSELTRINISNSLNGIIAQIASNSIFNDIQVVDCGGVGATRALGLFFGRNNQLINCSVIDFQGNEGISLSIFDSILENCMVQNLVSTANGVGIRSSGTNVLLKNCSVINIQSNSGSVGFSMSFASLENCFVQTCSSVTNFGGNIGFVIQNDATVINCHARESAAFGFLIIPGDILMRDCSAVDNSIDGFLFLGLNATVGSCAAYGNAGVGFNVGAVGVAPIYSCFASANGTNYVNVPNVAAAAVAGAFENAFI